MSAVLSVADAYRRSAFKLILRMPGARDIFVRPERRIPVAEALCVAAAGVTSLCFPVFSLWLGAALLGVPHVLLGIRHVALRRSLHPFSKACIGLCVAIGVLTLLHLTSGMALFVGLFALSMGVEVLASRAGAIRKVIWLATVALGASAAFRWPYFFILSVSHLHALGSLSFFSTEARRRGIRVWPLWGLTFAVTGAALFGALDGLVAHAAFSHNLGPDAVVRLVGDVAGISNPRLLPRSLFLYAFSQSVHYMVWLRLMPELDRPSPVPQSLRQAFVHLKRDFGRLTIPALIVCAVGAFGMLLGGGLARDAYFVLVYFHIGLEAAAWMRLRLAECRCAPLTASASRNSRLPLPPDLKRSHSAATQREGGYQGDRPRPEAATGSLRRFADGHGDPLA